MPTKHPQPNEQSPLFHERPNTTTSTSNGSAPATFLSDLFQRPPSHKSRKKEVETTPSKVAHHESHVDEFRPCLVHCPTATRSSNTSQSTLASTLMGSVTFLLYHVVYCLAQASTITRPHAPGKDHVMVGIVAQLAALGTLCAGPVYVYFLGGHVPALYPASDLFVTPFLAQVAHAIDDTLWEHGCADDDRVFLATFGSLVAIGLGVSGGLCILAARFRWCNLGSFLPYTVLCGFFTTIGLLIWSLGFSVDTGTTVGALVHGHNDTDLAATWYHAVLHHAPSLLIGLLLHFQGHQHPLFVIFLVLLTAVGSYVLLWWTETSLQQAQDRNWFFSAKELVDPPSLWQDSNLWESWITPVPLGVWPMIAHGDVHWPAFSSGLAPMAALCLLYVVRCSLHAAALQKNIPNVTRQTMTAATHEEEQQQVHPPQLDPISLSTILEQGYGYSQLVAALTGGITVAPAVAASLTMFKLGCEGVAPQYGSILLVLLFYTTNFQLVQYIPKPAVSCLMVLAGLDMCRTWLINSYFKSKAKLEWVVAPIIVVLAFSVGLLNAIFLGVAISTFIFVANFYRAGTVKYIGTGLTLRSTVERGVPEATWLDLNGDLIQIVVLQNYLFFGNAQSVFSYVATMFEEKREDQSMHTLPPLAGGLDMSAVLPKTKYVVVDFSLTTGVDTSAVDILREIVGLCRRNNCRLFFSGLSPSLRSVLLFAKVSTAQQRGTLSFAPDLESALAKAEDGLIQTVSGLKQQDESESHARLEFRNSNKPEDGFLYALRKIDEQHRLNTVEELRGLSPFMITIDLAVHQTLPWEDDKRHGLFFIEYGQLRVQHSSEYTSTATSFPVRAIAGGGFNPATNASIGHLDARSGTIGRQSTLQKLTKAQQEHMEQSFRLARIGQGWVVGSIESCSGMKRPGVYIAISECRVHHLQYKSLEKIESKNPVLAMNLYKLISNLSTTRQEMTIAQLAQFLSIMNSSAPTVRSY